MKKKRGVIAGVIFLLVFVTSLWALDAIQTQPSTDGSFELSLIRASVRGDVLTFQVAIKNTSSQRLRYTFFFRDVYYTDGKAKKKYYALKDSKGLYIAGPAYDHNAGGSFNMWLKPNGKALFWIKFPAPAEDVEEVDFYVPGALPFEGIKIKVKR